MEGVMGRIICWLKREHDWSGWMNVGIPLAEYRRHCVRCSKTQYVETQTGMIKLSKEG